MICCTRNLLSFLVAVLALTGCMSLAPRMTGPQSIGEIASSAAIAGGASATEVMITPTRVASATSTPIASPTYTTSPTATIQPTVTPHATASTSPTQAVPTSTLVPTVTPTPVATAMPEPPAVLVESAANIRFGPGIAYPVIGGARAGDRLSVTGRVSQPLGAAHKADGRWVWHAAFVQIVPAGQ